MTLPTKTAVAGPTVSSPALEQRKSLTLRVGQRESRTIRRLLESLDFGDRCGVAGQVSFSRRREPAHTKLWVIHGERASR